MPNDDYISFIMSELERVHSIDVEPVVRCRDCRYTRTDGIDAIYCEKWDRWEMPPDAYCYLGVNKEEKKVNEVPQEIIEGVERNIERLRQKAIELYDEQVAELRKKIEQLKAEIAKQPPLDYEKLTENPPTFPQTMVFGCGMGPPIEDNNENVQKK